MGKKQYNKRDRESEIRVSQVPSQVRYELRAIAKNIGIDFSVFMKQEFRLITNRYPPHMRINPDDRDKQLDKS